MKLANWVRDEYDFAVAESPQNRPSPARHHRSQCRIAMGQMRAARLPEDFLHRDLSEKKRLLDAAIEPLVPRAVAMLSEE